MAHGKFGRLRNWLSRLANHIADRSHLDARCEIVVEKPIELHETRLRRGAVRRIRKGLLDVAAAERRGHDAHPLYKIGRLPRHIDLRFDRWLGPTTY